MKQLTQNLKSGEMKVIEVAYPALSKGQILVRTHYSLISAGTESSKVQTARKGYIGKALERPKEVKKVIDNVKKEGLMMTYQKVMKKLDAPTELGYSAAGTVIAVGDDVDGFKVGDRVACAGAGYANHAEVISVPKNLAARLPENVSFKDASYTTVGAIALQGIRQADLKLGESCAVIGLGLLGQLTVQMLKASGVKVFGLDISKEAADLAKRSGADFTATTSDKAAIEKIEQLTGGIGTDAVIITAATSSLQPVETAGRLARKKAKVIIVGAVPTGFSRDLYYTKELELKMSCSYGPGRYDPNYEEKGIDYPVGYVRWTEQRNMQAFLDLIGQGKVTFSHLTTHTFRLEQAKKAYDMIVGRTEPFVGILLKYNTKRKIRSTIKEGKPIAVSRIKIGFIGAGSYAQSFILPHIKDAELVGVATSLGNRSRNVHRKFGFQYSTGDYRKIINDKKINTVFIVTRHDLHGAATIESLKANKNVYVEKPLAMTEDELQRIAQLVEKSGRQVMVGFNRRFSMFVKEIRSRFRHKPMSMIYRINAGKIPKEHWIQDKDIGGGRIVGEVCHFIDLLSHICDSPVKQVCADVMEDANNTMDTLNISLTFRNGSIGTVSYFANGSKELAKEYIEVYSHGSTAILEDFNRLTLYTSRKSKKKTLGQDKGQAEEITAYLNALKEGKVIPIPFKESYNSTLAAFKVIESIKTGKKIEL